MAKDTAKAIALCRVSTVKQSEEGTSLEAQEQRVYEAAAYFDAEIVKFWSIKQSSRKGKNYQRKDLVEMLTYAKSDKKVKYIIVDEPDRFMRDFRMYYYWQVRFSEEAGAKLVYAKKPHLANEDNMMSLMEEMLDVFRAEASNQERITKTTSNMQARVKLGYFPGRTKTGYRRTDTPGLFEPSEPAWSSIQKAFKAILGGITIKEAVQDLNESGFRTESGKPMDTFNFKKLMADPYYAGIIAMSDWEVNPNGLHVPMITIEEHEQLRNLAKGVVYKLRKKFRPDFMLSNVMACTDCLSEDSEKTPRLVGYDHNNGKKGNSYKTYKRYRCRSCGASMLQEELHNAFSNELLNLKLTDEKKDEFIGALRTVWKRDVRRLLIRSKASQTRLERLQEERKNVLRNALNNNLSQGDINSVLEGIDADIERVNADISQLEEMEKDFVDFVEFSLDFIENLRSKFWTLEADELGWCKQLLFPEGFSISRDKKVYTPKISEFYRVATSKEDPEGSSKSKMVGNRGFEPLTSSTSMKRSSQMS